MREIEAKAKPIKAPSAQISDHHSLNSRDSNCQDKGAYVGVYLSLNAPSPRPPNQNLIDHPTNNIFVAQIQKENQKSKQNLKAFLNEKK